MVETVCVNIIAVLGGELKFLRASVKIEEYRIAKYIVVKSLLKRFECRPNRYIQL